MTYHPDTRRNAKPATCKQCGTPVLTGPDHDVAALTVTVDATPIPPTQEPHALDNGLHTYTAAPAKGGTELWHRNRTHRAAPPALPIHVEHVCPHTAEELPL